MNDIIQIPTGPGKNFSYIFGDSEIVLIDPAYEQDKLEKIIENSGKPLKYIINTHSHFDHNSLNQYFQKKYNVPVIIHKAESSNVDEPKIVVNGGETFGIGKQTFRIVHTPGHTRGSITIVYNKALFTGDTLFADEDCGRIFYAQGIYDMFESLKFFKNSDSDYIIYSGHKYGEYDKTTLEYEQKNNPAMLCDTLEKLKEFKNV